MTATLEVPSTTTTTQTSTECTFVTFYLGDALVGLPIDAVQEINRQLEITPVPGTDTAILGVINLRGDVVPVVDLAIVLRLQSNGVCESTRNVIVNHGGQLVGLLVDRVADILRVDESEIRSAPANVDTVDTRHLRGVHTTETEIIMILEPSEIVC